MLRRSQLSTATIALLLLLASGGDASASNGTWERAWGRNVNAPDVFGICTVASSCLAGNTGGLGGEMNHPDGVAADASGNVYVADSQNNRIQKFDAFGTWERAWGKDVNRGGVFEVCTTAASCVHGVAGVLGGEMSDPEDVATDASGNVLRRGAQ